MTIGIKDRKERKSGISGSCRPGFYYIVHSQGLVEKYYSDSTKGNLRSSLYLGKKLKKEKPEPKILAKNYPELEN